MSTFAATWSEPVHQLCLSEAPNILSRDVLQSLICGSALSSSVDARVWKQLGLVHLLVVSGGHLVVLDFVLMKLLGLVGILQRWPRLSQTLRWSLMTAMIFANQFAPPVWRAYLAMAIGEPLHRRGWTSTQRGLAAFWLALAAVGSSGDLLSLALSAICAWILTWPRPLLSRGTTQTSRDLKNQLTETLMRLVTRVTWALLIQTLIWWGTWPLIARFGAPDPLATLTNLLLAPLLGVLLVPLALLALLIHLEIIHLLWESIWELTQYSLMQLAAHLPRTWAKETLSSEEIALLACALAVIFLKVLLIERASNQTHNFARRLHVQFVLFSALMCAAIGMTSL
ncbi:MAG TPA: ComEC/Rec2 family competence protein [Pseudobdellovibrionaceae bacterium]|nr:ComEC/Rec2 family competence protein [Pseudobdellovibrionaceae bacterium]